MTCKESKEMPINLTKPQRWWDIEVVYDGTRGWAMAAGNTPAEAVENFRSSIEQPELAVIVEIKPIGKGTVFEALSGVQRRGVATHIIVADAGDGNPDLDLPMQDAIAGYLRTQDQFLRSMDDLDAYIDAVEALYAAFAQDAGITDPNILCEAFLAFRKALVRQHYPDRAAMHITDFQ
jgi:hypothetical protein